MLVSVAEILAVIKICTSSCYKNITLKTNELALEITILKHSCSIIYYEIVFYIVKPITSLKF